VVDAASSDESLLVTPADAPNGLNKDREPTQQCSRCRSPIELLPPDPGLNAIAWRCLACGAIYFGGDTGQASRQGLIRIDPATQNPFAPANHYSIPPENVQRLTRTIELDKYTGPDRRGQKRYPIAVPVVAVPLAPDYRVDGDAVQMTTANISLSGAALVHTRFINSPYLAIDFASAGIDSLKVVLRVQRVRHLGPAYEIGGDFISRVFQLPNQSVS
jgi:hypothetical protein